MKNFPLSLKKSEVPDVVPEAPVPVLVSPFGPFLDFHFSYTEVSSRDGSTHVTSRQAHLEGGKLSTSNFEGDLPSGVYDQMVSEVQRQFLDQAGQMMRSLSWFLPPSLRLPFERD